MSRNFELQYRRTPRCNAAPTSVLLLLQDQPTQNRQNDPFSSKIVYAMLNRQKSPAQRKIIEMHERSHFSLSLYAAVPHQPPVTGFCISHPNALIHYDVACFFALRSAGCTPGVVGWSVSVPQGSLPFCRQPRGRTGRSFVDRIVITFLKRPALCANGRLEDLTSFGRSR